MKRLTLAAALFLTSALPVLAEETATVAPAASAPAISVATVKGQVLRDSIFVSGPIEPVEQVAVQPQIEGQRIEELLVDIGDSVEKGEVLAVLADDSLKLQRTQLDASHTSALAAVAQAQASLAASTASAEEAVRVRDRTQRLRTEGTASQAAADTATAAATSALASQAAAEQGLAAARAQVALVEAQMADLDLKIERTRITAPVGGIISDRNALVGAIGSAAGTAMFVIIRDGALELRADVSEQDVLKLQAGQGANLRVVGLRNPLTGTVRLVEPTVDLTTRLGSVRIALDDSSSVRAGLFAEAEILIEERDGLSVPVTAVATTIDRDSSVLRVDDAGKVERVAVETGIRDGGLLEITQGLNDGDVIVARAGAFVRAGDTITPVAVETTN